MTAVPNSTRERSLSRMPFPQRLLPRRRKEEEEEDDDDDDDDDDTKKKKKSNTYLRIFRRFRNFSTPPFHTTLTVLLDQKTLCGETNQLACRFFPQRGLFIL